MLLVVYCRPGANRDLPKAGDALNGVESALKNLPADYKTDWSWQGTLRYIRASHTPEALKTDVADLIEAVDKDPLHVPPAVLQANREAVKRK